jgi:hypothetical protein
MGHHGHDQRGLVGTLGRMDWLRRGMGMTMGLLGYFAIIVLLWGIGFAALIANVEAEDQLERIRAERQE